MPIDIFVRLEPLPGKEREIRDELALVIEPTREEPGCIRINIFESTREPVLFYIYSEWTDEAAFDLHAKLPHTQRFLTAVNKLITHPVHAVRTRQIG
jgi:quinol monooxygenase YgiN